MSFHSMVLPATAFISAQAEARNKIVWARARQESTIFRNREGSVACSRGCRWTDFRDPTALCTQAETSQRTKPKILLPKDNHAIFLRVYSYSKQRARPAAAPGQRDNHVIFPLYSCSKQLHGPPSRRAGAIFVLTGRGANPLGVGDGVHLMRRASGRGAEFDVRGEEPQDKYCSGCLRCFGYSLVGVCRGVRSCWSLLHFRPQTSTRHSITRNGLVFQIESPGERFKRLQTQRNDLHRHGF